MTDSNSVGKKPSGSDTWTDAWNKVMGKIHLPFFNAPTDVHPHDLIWLHTNTAFPRGDGYWAEFVASFFHNDSGEKLSEFVSEVSTHLGLAEDDHDTRKIVEERAELFLNRIIVGRKLPVHVDPHHIGHVLHLPPSGSSGISAIECAVPFQQEPQVNDIVRVKAVLPDGFRNVPVETDMKVVAAEGWTIISDIDDTIKVTDTLDMHKLLQHTFAEEAVPTPGFPEFYAELKTTLNDPAFFYLSASPYNLYPFLLEFARKNYPFGQLILRDMSWMSVAGLVNSVSVGTQEYKTMEMRRVMGEWLPGRKYLCIGDSTQTDPESYAEMYRAYPDKVKAIWIRVVTGVNLDEEKKKNAQERFDKAFDGVPSGIWRTFHDVSELKGLASQLEL